MPQPGVPLEKLGFLTIGLFDGSDPGPGHESTLEIISLGERLGFDSAWLRHRHLQYGISSPVAIMAAASQRTSRIELGTAVTPLGWENPLRLAEDLATVDILSGGRINPGVSVGQPAHWDDVRPALYPSTGDRRGFARGVVLGDGRVRAVLVSRAAALPRAAVPHVVRRRERGVGTLGGLEFGELPDQQRGAGACRRAFGFRGYPGFTYPGVPGGTSGWPGRPGVAGARGDSDGQRFPVAGFAL
jgi:luciferase-like monooxygenase